MMPHESTWSQITNTQLQWAYFRVFCSICVKFFGGFLWPYWIGVILRWRMTAPGRISTSSLESWNHGYFEWDQCNWALEWRAHMYINFKFTFNFEWRLIQFLLISGIDTLKPPMTTASVSDVFSLKSYSKEYNNCKF